MTADSYDIIVIGAGQGGGPLAVAFAKAGRRAALVERAHVGGTCVNVGCTPTKTMIASARVASLARRASDYGVRVGDVSVDLARVRERKRAIVESFRSGSAGSLTRAGVEVIEGTARFAAARTVETELGNGTRRSLSAPVIVIDTGVRPASPPVPGLDSVPAFDSTTVMELDEIPEHLIVLGGGYVGLEFAQMFRRFGSRVTVIQRSAQLLPREDPDVAHALATILREDGLDVLLGTTTVRVRGAARGVVVTARPTNDQVTGGDGQADARGPGARELAGSHLLVATGRVPNTAALALDTARVETDARGYIVVDEMLQTTAPGIYAIGDVTGGAAFTHVSYDDYRVLRRNLLERGAATTRGRVVPYTVFTDPQLGRVGMTETQARRTGRVIGVATLPMARVARALETDEPRGFMKAVVDTESGQILGAAVLGVDGGEVAAVIQAAMMGGLPYTALRDAMFAHPTLAESLNNLFAALQ